MCRFAARAAARLDRRGQVALLPLEDDAAAALVARLPEQERSASWHLVQPDGHISSRGATGIELLHALGLERPAGVAARFPAAVERLYGLVADHRDKLGRLIPDGPAPRRFP